MPLRYLLDEHLRGPLWRATLRHNAMDPGFPLDVVRVGDPHDLPLGLADPLILAWAERNDRILVTRDSRTIPAHLASHLLDGGHSPGIVMLRPNCSLQVVVAQLVLAAHASDPAEWRDRITYVPVPT